MARSCNARVSQTLLVSHLLLVLFVVFSSAKKDKGTHLKACDLSNGKGCVWRADYIVVGSGAGSVAARRLTDDHKYSGILLEAGPNLVDDPIISWGEAFLGIFPNANKYNWQLKSEPDALGRTVDVQLGRQAGGSFSHNGFQYIRTSPQFSDSVWVQAGGNAWNSTNMAAAYKAMENYTVSSLADGPVAPTRGVNGSFNVRRPMTGPHSGPNSLAYRLASLTAEATGIPMTDDYNDPSDPRKAFGSFPRYQLSQTPDGFRESSYTAFLPPSVVTKDGYPADGRQLRVLFHATVTRVVFQGNKAIGVEFNLNGVTNYARATKEVILAGSIFTSQILQNSGIGNATFLQSKGIPVIVNNPNVGERSVNHVSVTLPIIYNATEAPGSTIGEAGSIYTGGAFLPKWNWDGPISNLTLLDQPRDFQLIWFSTLFPGYYALFVSPLQPKSEGYDRIFNSDPNQPLLHNDAALMDPRDLDDVADFYYHCVQNTIMEYMHTQDPAYNIGWNRWNSTDDAKATILAAYGRTAHPMSHTRMASSINEGVVDGQGRVFGAQNLRIVGAPILPGPVDSTPAAPSLATAWIITGMIIAERNN